MITFVQIIQPDALIRHMPVASKLVTKGFGHQNPAADRPILELVFAWFNAGSGDECPEFWDAKMRSLSEGDYVVLTFLSEPDSKNSKAIVTTHRCDRVGWTEVSCEQMVNDIVEQKHMPDWMKEGMEA